MLTRRALLVVACLSVVAGLGLLLGTTLTPSRAAGLPFAPASPSISKSPEPPPPPTLRETTPVQVQLASGAAYAWSLLDRTTGETTGSANSTTYHNTTESMVKAWLVADFLRRLGDRDPTTAEKQKMSTAIRDSNDDSAQWLYLKDGGNASIKRLFSTCDLVDRPVIQSGWWSMTQLTARDAARMGACIADGTAAGDKWTSYLLNEMEHVRGTAATADQHATWGGGRWGIIDGLPAQLQSDTAIKNGWTLINADGKWHVNCLAVHSDWTLAVQVKYPGKLGLAYGANVCESVTRQLVYQPASAEG
ncbi:MAG: hypothetical protein HOV71_18220 [Hamadaea sp.]|nr:hypothetical protein [Hamadaea sp.]NUT05005.1 hypothetical protein [Hamadaea sp.]